MNGEDEKNPVKRDIHNDNYDHYHKKRADSDWDDSNDIHEFPTNAFGLCEFINEDAGSDKPAKYVRLSGASHFLSPIKTYQHIIREVDLGIYPGGQIGIE